MLTERDNQCRTLWYSWTDLNESTEDAIRQRIYEIFTEIKQAACLELERSAAGFARMGNDDEHVYEYLQKLMGVYRQIVNLSGNISQEHSDTGVLLAGICDVLESRLKEFEDVTQCADSANPITQEKYDIVNRAKRFVFSSVYDLLYAFVGNLPTRQPDVWASLIADALNPSHDIMVRLKSEIKDECLPKIYTYYQAALQSCLSQLEDLNERKTTSLYFGLIEREWEELGNIIKVQVAALEAAETDDLDAGEFDTVQHILNILRETYQYTGPVIDELQRLLHTPATEHTGLSYEAFTEVVNDALNAKEWATLHIEESDFFALLAEEIAVQIAQLPTDLSKTAALVQQMIDSNKLLAEEAMQVFAEVKKLLPSAECELPETEVLPQEDAQLQLSILAGISETIEIKCDSLRESIQTFGEDGENLLRSVSEEKVTLSDTEIKKVQDTVLAAWITSPPCHVANFFTALSEGDIFAPLHDRINKRVAFYLEKAEKLTFRFKKEVVLYEICTYEEILTHSASRLRDSAWADMAMAEKELSAAYYALGALLEKSNIIAIRPAPHEQFNAFEHEILLAEIQEGFAKGEIIKVLNTGYKQNDKVILRANVIAAK